MSFLIIPWLMISLSTLQGNAPDIDLHSPTRLFKAGDPPIRIDGNGNFTDYGFLGNGSRSSPYIIENLVIEANDTPGIQIWNTDAHFILRNCTVFNSLYTSAAGIYLNNVSNSVITNNTAYMNNAGIDTRWSANVNITWNTFRDNGIGIFLFNPAPGSLIANNTISTNQWGVLLGGGKNTSLFKNMINENDEFGIKVELSHNNTISFNSVNDNNKTGIWIENSDDNTVTWNAVHRNNQSIIETGTSAGNIIANNDYYAANLTSGGVSPLAGNISTTFTYSVNYTEVENDTPAVIRVVIDGVPYNLTKQNAGDNSYVDGCVYILATNLSGGDHTYHFEASDGTELIRFPPPGEMAGPSVNAPPFLSMGSVSPTNGTLTTIFTFSVNYTDVDNDTPAFIRVVVNGSQFDLTKQNSSDHNYRDGCLYLYTTNLSAGSYIYYFETSDGVETASSENFNGPDVTVPDTGTPIPGFGWMYIILAIGIMTLLTKLLRSAKRRSSSKGRMNW